MTKLSDTQRDALVTCYCIVAAFASVFAACLTLYAVDVILLGASLGELRLMQITPGVLVGLVVCLGVCLGMLLTFERVERVLASL